MQKNKYMIVSGFVASLAISGLLSSASAQGIKFQEWVKQVRSVLNGSESLLKLDETPWPFIHHDPKGSKSSSYCAPRSTSPSFVESKVVAFEPSIVNLHGRRYFYVQGALSGLVYAIDPENIGTPSGIINTFYPGAVYPYSGGGVIDSNHRLWWTNETKLISVAEDLSDPVYSQDLPSGVWNGSSLLADGNMLVTGNRIYAVVGTQKVGDNFPIISQGEFPFPTQPGSGEEEGLGPRPVSDDSGHFYFVTSKSVERVTYDISSKTLIKTSSDWGSSISSEITLGISNAVIVGDKVCANSDSHSTSPMYVFCFNKNDGTAYPPFEPFPGAMDIESTWHTLGSVPEENLLIVIGSSPSGSAGISAFNLNDMKRRWYVSLHNVSNAFSISTQSKRVYISSRKNLLSNFEIHSIDYRNGSDSIIYSDKIQGMPGKSLGIVGLQGNIFVPYALGMIRLQDKTPNCL